MKPSLLSSPVEMMHTTLDSSTSEGTHDRGTARPPSPLVPCSLTTSSPPAVKHLANSFAQICTKFQLQVPTHPGRPVTQCPSPHVFGSLAEMYVRCYCCTFVCFIPNRYNMHNGTVKLKDGREADIRNFRTIRQP